MQAIQEIVAALAGATERELARTALSQALEQSASDEITRERLKQLLDASDHWAMDRVSRPLVDAVFCLSAPLGRRRKQLEWTWGSSFSLPTK